MPAIFLRGVALLHFGAMYASAQDPGSAGCPCITSDATTAIQIQSNYGDTSTGSTKLQVDIGGVKYMWLAGLQTEGARRAGEGVHAT